MVGPIRNCLNNSGVDKVGVLFDVYGSEFAHNHHDLKGHALWRAVKTDAETSILNADDAAQRLVVGPVLYEFETLVIAALATGATQEKSAIVQRAQRAISQAGGDVEIINGAPSTSPSHRISQWWSECLHQRYENHWMAREFFAACGGQILNLLAPRSATGRTNSCRNSFN